MTWLFYFYFNSPNDGIKKNPLAGLHSRNMGKALYILIFVGAKGFVWLRTETLLLMELSFSLGAQTKINCQDAETEFAS